MISTFYVRCDLLKTRKCQKEFGCIMQASAVTANMPSPTATVALAESYIDLDLHRVYKMLFTASILRFRRCEENLCAERVCLVLLCSLKTNSTRGEEGDRGMKMRGRWRSRKIKGAIALMCLWYVCLCCHGDLFSPTPSPCLLSLSLAFKFFLVWIFFAFLSCICRLSRQCSVSLSSDVSIKINGFSLLR